MLASIVTLCHKCWTNFTHWELVLF